MLKLTRLLKTGVFAGAITLASLARAGDLAIGAIFPLSGPNASYSDIFGSGVNLAVEHINADNTIGGKLSVQYEDSQALPQQGLIAMTKLVNVVKVPYALSAFTGVSKAVSTVGERTKTVAINGGGVGPDLAELGQYFWNVIPLVNFEYRVLWPYMVKERNLKRFVLVYVDDPIGQSVVKEMTALLPTYGGQLVESMSIPVSAQQFGGIAARVRAANPDAVYIVSYGAQQAQIIKQFRDNGVKQQLASYSAMSIPEVQNLPEAMGLLFTTQQTNWASADPVTRRFVDDFRKKHNKSPTAYVANYYNAVRLFGLLTQELNKKGLPVTGENLLKQRVEMKSFDMVGGKMVFNDNGTVMMPIQINEVDGKGGKMLLAQ